MDNRQPSSSNGVEGEHEVSRTYRASTDATRPLREDSEPTSSTSGSHKRTISGSILSRLSFLRPSSEFKSGSSSNYNNAPNPAAATASAPGATGTSQYSGPVPPTTKTRSRKGSLRKTALLGGGKLRSNEKRLQAEIEVLSKTDDTSSIPLSEADSSPIPPSPPDMDDYPTPRASYEKSSTSYPDSAHGATQASQQGRDWPPISNMSEESLPLPGAFSRKSTLGDMSTTDEDETLKYPLHLLTIPSSSSGPASILKKHGASDPYFPLDTSLQRRRSSHRPRAKSPLASLPIEPVQALPPEEWDYSETEWWGWVILVLTWVVFVMGMGSCFEVWSWAWDVGETPYAPPELEDDPTLPIVGYYPALIILTGVMAWVWVVVAWVGMKYFRHAKMAGDM
ncbi:MAG: hypothetical protein LQ340_004649 [Diploschistes diacapsis]|nr:MAG: hypothetical protein LQ340_004649 [Diploschistes diacapsis]